ncbi:MAG TPA: hypothetical protein VNO75_09265 [Gemmatimonadaceae bacterium]|nr:hypothetical protein [Gemmatimonadaceae bacterium]
MSLSWGIDTTVTDIRNIVSLVRAYLAKPDSSARSRGLWSTSTDFDRRVGDLTVNAYQGFPATIVGITPDASGDGAYVVKILHASADSTRRRITPLALQRLYAVREAGGPFSFKLASALPRLTSHWERRSQGRLRFIYAPGQHPNPERIDRAAAFVDSVTKLFRVPAPTHLDVYITASIDEAERAIGFDFSVQAGDGRGGKTLTQFNTILAGDPRTGEAYLHEFVHAVLVPTFPFNNGIFNEGVATWLGGSQARTPQQMYALLRQYQIARPTLTISKFLREDPPDAGAQAWSDADRATSALVVDTIYRRRGIDGLRAFALLKHDTDTLLAALPTQLGLASADPAALDRWWRIEAERASRGP